MSATADARPSMVVGLRLLRLVGSGGEGEVWEARDERGRARALKLIRPDALAADADVRGRHLLAIDHPALVRVYRGGRLRGGSLDGWGFLEMDYIDGPSLQDAPPDPAVLDRLWPLAEALDLLHAGEWTEGLPLVHRDVKPANLVEDADGDLVLVDPSTLRGIDATELTRIGTPVFSAPEVMTGRFGPPADIYSFAVTVVALLTGTRGEELAGVLDEAHHLDLPDGVAYALSPVPGDRPTSCRAVLQAGAELADDPTILLPALHHWPAEAEPWPAEAERWSAEAPPYAPHHPPTLHADAPWPARASSPAQEHPMPPRAAERRRRLWPWTWLFTLLVGAPLVALWAGVVPRERLLPAVVALAAAHLVATLAGGVSAGLAVLLPPVAWAVLLGRRVQGGPRRRAWASAMFTAAIAPLVGGVAMLVAGGNPRRPTEALIGGAATLVLVLLTSAVANGREPGAVLMRTLLIPLWLAGAMVLILGGLLLVPFGVARGVAWTTFASLPDGLRGPAMMPRGYGD